MNKIFNFIKIMVNFLRQLLTLIIIHTSQKIDYTKIQFCFIINKIIVLNIYILFHTVNGKN